MRYVLKVAYDGTEFAGWQRQKNLPSVQEAIENALKEALGLEVKVTGSGRTDAGVHAAGQVCHFDAACSVPPNKMPECLNAYLPPSVRVLDGRSATESFDCCRGAKRKTYVYSLYVSSREMPLKERYAVRVEKAADLKTLQNYARLLEGEKDFKAFCASGSAVKTTVRTVYEVRVEEGFSFGSRDIKISVCGNGFLYNMVRTMVGELLELSAGRRSEESLQRAFTTGERGLLGKTMPAKGLCLFGVEYGEENDAATDAAKG